MPATFSLYLARRFAVMLAAVAAGMAGVYLAADLIETLRQLTGRSQGGFALALQLAALRLPTALPAVLPFAALIAGILCYGQLTRSNELIVARAAGISAWQFSLPAVAVALAFGAVFVAAINPLGATLYARHDALLRGAGGVGAPAAALLPGGLWLRQGDDDGGYTLIHAGEAARDLSRLSRVLVMRFDAADRFLGRIDAAEARLEPGAWRLFGAARSAPGGQPEAIGDVSFATDLTRDRIQAGFAPIETQSVWDLPGVIAQFEASGFDAARYRLQFQRLTALPAFLAGMTLIGLVFALRPTRRGGAALMMAAGIAAGFAVFLFSSFVGALGLSQHLPAWAAAWIPPACAALAGASLIAHVEDG